MIATTLISILYGVAVLLAAGIAGVFAARRRHGPLLVYSSALVTCATLFIAALRYVLTGANAVPESQLLPIGLPWIGAHFDLDLLAALFLLVTNLGGVTASLYGLGIGRHERAPARVLPFFPLFLAAMNLLVIAGDAFTYLLSWEFMSLTSWALVMAHHEESDNRMAGYLYLVMASFGTLSLLLAFGLLAPAGAYAFADIRALDHDLVRTGIVFCLALIGCGSKAGLVPLHAWLPLAHPAAPSHVSALMSGVMTKVAIYGFIRIVFDLLGPPSDLVERRGAVDRRHQRVDGRSARADGARPEAPARVPHGREHRNHLHRARSRAGVRVRRQSIGQRLLRSSRRCSTCFNHSLFKSLLFYGAGAVHATTHERDMEHLGGLIHRMPVTAFAFLVGSMAISALPPLNGFVSEWLTFQAILVSPQLSAWGLKFLIPAVGAMLALSAALAAACFVKAYGLTFLGRPRSSAAQIANDAHPASRIAMLTLVALCVVAGILPGYVIDAIAPLTEAFVGGHMPLQADQSWLTIVPIDRSRSSYNGFARLSVHGHSRRRSQRTSFTESLPAKYAAHRHGTAVTPIRARLLQYTASSFAQPIRRVFGTLFFQARETVSMPKPGEVSAAHFRVVIRDLIWEALYVPIGRYVNFVADRANRAQFLTIRQYLGLVFMTLVSLLSLLALLQ